MDVTNGVDLRKEGLASFEEDSGEWPAAKSV
jgi:hypothetical protein